jgi:hypothetical protein
LITEILENMSKKTPEKEILERVKSDHLPQMFEIELDSKKSTFVNLNKFNKDRFYDFINNPDDTLKQVPVAITGSTDDGIFWQIGGGGMNGSLQKYLESKKDDTLKNANQELAKQRPERKEDAIGRITQVDLGLTEDAQVQKILYSASPDLSALDGNKTKKAMIAFGKKFRDQLNDQDIKELCLPLYSGGIYNGNNTQKLVAEWLMEGWFLAERKNQSMKKVKVYLGHEYLVDAVEKVAALAEKKTSKPLSTSEASDNSKILAEGKFVPKFVPKGAASENPDLENSAKITSQKEMEAKIMLGNIKEKIFANPNGTDENLSAEDVAIKKIAGNDEKRASEVKKWSKPVLEYAAKGVFNKALKAEENKNTRNSVKGEDWGGKSQEVWYNRFVRTDFEGVDLSKTFRTVFVNCTFDKNCVLPSDPSSIDPKYFSNCQFSKELMDKKENQELKKALERAGMTFDKVSGSYKIGNIKRKIYGEENSEGTPDSSCKPIESFKLIPNFRSNIKSYS